jgi:four helix bundle protein
MAMDPTIVPAPQDPTSTGVSSEANLLESNSPEANRSDSVGVLGAGSQLPDVQSAIRGDSEKVAGQATGAPVIGAQAIEAQATEAQATEAQATEAQATAAQATEAQTIEAQTIEAQTIEAQAIEAQSAQARAAQAKAAKSKASGANASSAKASRVQAVRIRQSAHHQAANPQAAKGSSAKGSSVKGAMASATAQSKAPQATVARSMAAQFTAARALAENQRSTWTLADGLAFDLSNPSLRLWHEAIALSDLCHEATQQSQSRCYGLMAQIRWGASLIPANIADGSGLTAPARPESLQSAYAALLELKTHLQVAEHTQVLPAAALEEPLRQWDVVVQQLRQLLSIAAA